MAPRETQANANTNANTIANTSEQANLDSLVWYVADGTHAPNTLTGPKIRIKPKRLQRAYASLRQRTEDALHASVAVREALENGELLSLNCDELKPKDEMLAIGSKSFRSEDECSIAAKGKVERKVKNTVAQFRHEQMRERELAARVCRSVRKAAARDGKEREDGGEQGEGDGDERIERNEGGDGDEGKDGGSNLGNSDERENITRTNAKRRRTWVEHFVMESRKEAESLAEQAGMSRVPADELVYKVLVYLPRSPAFVSEEYLVLGSTPLTALRDMIYCVMDVNAENLDALKREMGDQECRVADGRAFFVKTSTSGTGGDKTTAMKFFEDRREYRGGRADRTKHGRKDSALLQQQQQTNDAPAERSNVELVTVTAGRSRRATTKTSKMALFVQETAGEATGGTKQTKPTRLTKSTKPTETSNKIVPAKTDKKDLSAPLVEHLRNQGHDCAVMGMENVCFTDLGDVTCDREDRPMMYCHQSCCEHIVKIVDVRIFNPIADPQWVNQYPYRIYCPGGVVEHRRMCELCANQDASRITFYDKHTPHSPYYWCDGCFESLHVDEHGKLLYDDFEVYPYEHGYINLGVGGSQVMGWQA